MTLRLCWLRRSRPHRTHACLQNHKNIFVLSFFCTGRDRNQMSTHINSLYVAAHLPFQIYLYIAQAKSQTSRVIRTKVFFVTWKMFEAPERVFKTKHSLPLFSPFPLSFLLSFVLCKSLLNSGGHFYVAQLEVIHHCFRVQATDSHQSLSQLFHGHLCCVSCSNKVCQNVQHKSLSSSPFGLFLTELGLLPQRPGFF